MSLKPISLLLLALVALSCLGCARADPIPPQPRLEIPFLVGGDVSFLARIEGLGGRYKDEGREKDALDIFKSHGANAIRLRLWVAPDGQGMNVNDLAYTIALAKRVKSKGFRFLLDIHYSDVWADPAHQAKPAAWKSLSFEQLIPKVETYSRWVIATFRKAGAMPDMVQIGNETPNGMLWPDGNTLEAGGWARFAKLFGAGARGVRAGAAPAKAPAILLHLNNGDTDLWKWFLGELKSKGGGADFDAIGLSYYPDSSSRLSTLKSSMADLARTAHKPIILVETNYPFAESDEVKRANWEWAPTPQGQKEWLQHLIQTVREVPDGLGRGVFWWAPEWVPIDGLGHYLGPKMLFDEKFEALPALDALRATAPR